MECRRGELFHSLPLLRMNFKFIDFQMRSYIVSLVILIEIEFWTLKKIEGVNFQRIF
jgi:hypothetical protein